MIRARHTARVVVAALTAVACNQVYGLDETTPSGDRDDDGVLDSIDNCPDVPNVDQANADGDVLGDACDRCATPSTSNHDEDSDGVPDDCDPCPVIEDFHTDGDADGVGDTCDPQAGPSRRDLFDPFTRITDRWRPTGTWSLVGGDAIAPVPPLAPSTRLALSGSAIEVGRLFVGIASSRPWTASDRFGVVFRDATDAEAFRCEILCGATCNLEVSGPAVATSLDRPEIVPTLIATVRIELEATNVRCFVSNSASSPFLRAGLTAPGPWSIALIASPAIAIGSVDVIVE